jgi:hypothetical protein
MTYSSSGLIQGSDYNNFVGGNGSNANVSGQLNSVLGVGLGSAGYGQTAVTNVTAITDTVAATQWTTLINGVDKVRKHQSGGGYTNLSVYTAGDTINATNNISGALTTAYSSRLTAVAQGTTTTGGVFSPVFTAPNDTNAATFAFSRTATFASADQARYFFNAGGQLNFVVTSVTNTGGTTRGASLATVAGTNFASKKIGADDCVARTGTGGTLNVDGTTGTGYYSSTTSNVAKTTITGLTTAYLSDTLNLFVKTNGVQGSNGDDGTVMTISMVLLSAAQSPAFDDSINITVGHRVDVIYPSTTFLANTWGSVTIA